MVVTLNLIIFYFDIMFLIHYIKKKNASTYQHYIAILIYYFDLQLVHQIIILTIDSSNYKFGQMISQAIDPLVNAELRI
jgi:hypothetical protein